MGDDFLKAVRVEEFSFQRRTATPVPDAGPSAPSVELTKSADAETTPIEQAAETTNDKGAEMKPADPIRKLALLKPGTIPYDMALEAARKAYGNGVRKSTVEKLVAEEKARYASQMAVSDEAERQRRIASAPTVDGARLLRDLDRLIDSFVWMTPERRLVFATWILHTHTIEAADFTPYMHVRSPIKRCAKTLLQMIARQLVWQPQFASVITTAALIDKVSKGCTLLVDEADATFQGPATESTETKRAILNSGHWRGGTASKMVKDAEGGWTSEDYPTFGAKAVGGIGHLPDTIEDRSLDLLLLRKPKSISKERFVLGRNAKGRAVKAKLAELRRRIDLWAAQNLPALMEAEPEMPPELDDRAVEIAEPLCAIADVCGDEWPVKVRQAIVAVRSGAMSEDNGPIVDLLTDIRRAFSKPIDAVRDGKVSTQQLVNWLQGQERWEHFAGRGQPLPQRRMLSMLRDLEIEQHSVWIAGQRQWGFEAVDFQSAFESCLPTTNEPECEALNVRSQE